jgi:hypothetical protein
MIIKEIILTSFDVNPARKFVSVEHQTILTEDGEELSRGVHRCTFMPGQMDKLIECLGAESLEVAYMSSIWTPEVVAAYEKTKLKSENI